MNMTVSEFCEHYLEITLQLVYYHRAFMIAICALNLVFSLVAVLGNILIIRALLKASSIPTNLKTFFCSLAFSDLAVGLFAQLSNSAITTVILIMKVDGNNNLEFFCPIILSVYFFFTFSSPVHRYLLLQLSLWTDCFGLSSICDIMNLSRQGELQYFWCYCG